jgi:hypothetical protein
MNRPAMSARGHWYRIRLVGSVLESALEQERTLKAMQDGMAERAKAAAGKRAAGQVVQERPARVYTRREDGAIVWYLDDGALALYRVAGGLREAEAHLDELPAVEGLSRALNGRYYAME